MLEPRSSKEANFWILNSHVWRLQYHHSESVYGITQDVFFSSGIFLTTTTYYKTYYYYENSFKMKNHQFQTQNSMLLTANATFCAIHTVAIWTFTFHKKSGFVKVILKANFKPVCRPVLWTFWSENSGFLNSFSFFFLQQLSNPLFFEHCCCYSNDLTYLSCNLMQMCDHSISTFLK